MMSQKAKEVWKTLEGYLAELGEGLKEGHTEGFLRFLERMGHFHRYSLHNTLLILRQRPEATLVAGLKAWNRVGRRVKRGEKGIAILAPLTRKEKVEEEGEVKEVERLIGFRVAHVFDISQTEGEPLDPWRDYPEGPEGVLERLKEACPFPVREEPLPELREGYTDGKEIVLSSLLPPTRRAEVFLHEWVHALLHFGEERPPKPLAELEAEATAYAVGRHLGLPMRGSRDYILSYRGRVEDLEASLERVHGAAKAILEALSQRAPEVEGSAEAA